MGRKKDEVALVAGGAGFIGSHLCERLVNGGARVICLDNLLTGRRSNLAAVIGHGSFGFIEHDVIDELPSELFSTPFTHIYHLACAASPADYQADPEHTMLTNVVGTRNLLRLAESTGARLLLTSTSEVYGDPEIHPQREDYCGAVNCTGPRACYDEGKRAAETLAFDFRRTGRAQVRVARIFNTYGPRMRPDDGRVVSNFICQALSGDAITVYGDGSQTRSFCFVEDLLDALCLLMESEKADGVPVNLGNPAELAVADLVEIVLELTGSRSEVVFHPLPKDDPKRRRPDIARAGQLLGWKPTTTLRDGLIQTIEWFAGEDNAGWQGEDAGSLAYAAAAE